MFRDWTVPAEPGFMPDQLKTSGITDICATLATLTSTVTVSVAAKAGEERAKSTNRNKTILLNFIFNIIVKIVFKFNIYN
jgi:hypothetical protein